MPNVTGRLLLPYILQSQSQKEVSHNDALNILDVLIQAVAQDVAKSGSGLDMTVSPAPLLIGTQRCRDNVWINSGRVGLPRDNKLALTG